MSFNGDFIMMVLDNPPRVTLGRCSGNGDTMLKRRSPKSVQDNYSVFPCAKQGGGDGTG